MVQLVDRRTQFELRLHCRWRRRFILFICSFVRPFRFLFHFIFIGGVRVSAVYGRIQRRRKYDFHSLKFTAEKQRGRKRKEGRELCVCVSFNRLVLIGFDSFRLQNSEVFSASTRKKGAIFHPANEQTTIHTKWWNKKSDNGGVGSPIMATRWFGVCLWRKWICTMAYSISVQLSHPICLALFTFEREPLVDLFCGTCSRLSGPTPTRLRTKAEQKRLRKMKISVCT